MGRAVLFGLIGLAAACAPAREGEAARLKIAVAFETLQTPFWRIAWETFERRGQERAITVVQAVAGGDANTQFDQVRGFLAQGVDGLVIVPRDSRSVVPMIEAANAAGVPVVLFNRPAEPTAAPHAVVAPDNEAITRAAVEALLAQAPPSPRPLKAAILLGDLDDVNAVGRQRGFDAAVRQAARPVEVVARVPTGWNQERALAGLREALRAHPDLGLLYTSSDFMLPSVQSALEAVGRWKKAGEAGHVLLAGFDGDPVAYTMLVDGYLDASGVQDVFWEVDQALSALEGTARGRPLPGRIADPGLVVTRANLDASWPRMWGAVLVRRPD